MTPQQIDVWLEHHADLATERIGIGMRAATAQVAHVGGLKSGRHIKMHLAVIETELSAFIAEAFEVAPAIEAKGGDLEHFWRELGTHVIQRSMRGREAMKFPKAFYPESAEREANRINAENRAKLLKQIEFRSAGFAPGAGPAGPTYNVSGSQGVQIQHNSPGASQSLSLDVAKAASALADLDRNIDWASLPEAPAADLRAELETLAAQLRKASPSKSILQEAGQSVRSLSEGVLAGMLTEPAIKAAGLLFAALGLP